MKKYQCFILALCLLTTLNQAIARSNVETVSHSVHKLLSKAQALHLNNKHRLALDMLGHIKQANLSSFEISQVWNMKGFVYFSQDKYTQAISAFRKSLEHPTLSKSITLNALQTIAQSHFLLEQYSYAIRAADEFTNIEPLERPELYTLKAQAHYQINQFKPAINSMQQAIKLKKQHKQKINENDLLILSACFQELNQTRPQIRTLKQLIKLYPKKQYFLALSSAYYDLGHTKKQLAIYETLYEKNWLTQTSQLTNLAQLYLLNDAPFKAVKVIQDGINNKSLPKNLNNLRLLSHAWYAARRPDKAVAPLTQAAKKDKYGKTYMRLGYLLSEIEQWDNAIDAFDNAKKHGGLPKKNNIDLLTGIACYHAGHIGKAKRAFTRSIQNKQYADSAKIWLDSVIQKESTVIN